MLDRAASSSALAPSAPESLSGRLLGGRYRIGELVSSDGPCRVFRAVHMELGRPCAVKVIRPPASGLGPAWRAARARFRVEALAAARLDHPNVLRVLDFGRESEDGLHYLVLEQAEGVDLAAVLADEAPLPAARIARIGRGLCAALQHAHERGVIHRDLRPENVRLVRGVADDGGAAEAVKLLDFGAASIRGEDPGSDGPALDAHPYGSPEQAAGSAIDARSDLYALGALLFELATAHRPERGPSRASPPSPTSLGASVDRGLSAIILGCLRPLPDDRPGSAREVRDALGAVLERVEPRRPRGAAALSERSGAPLSSESLVVGARGAATVVGMAVAAALWWQLYVQQGGRASGAVVLDARLGPHALRLPETRPAAARAPAHQLLRDAGVDAAPSVALDGGPALPAALEEAAPAPDLGLQALDDDDP